MIIKTKYEFGDPVYIKNDEDQKEYILTGVINRMGRLLYEISRCGEVTVVYDIELSKEIDANKLYGIKKKKGEDEDDE